MEGGVEKRGERGGRGGGGRRDGRGLLTVYKCLLSLLLLLLLPLLPALPCARLTRCPPPPLLQGYVLGQYGLLYCLRHPDKVSRLLILNTPVSTKTALRPELAAYKSPIPFLRPGNVCGGQCVGGRVL